MNTPLLSVIIPCYNTEKYLEKCITSILKQSYTNIEVILINDGSTDKTPLICNNLSNIDKRIKVIHQSNQGASITRQNGINLSKGEYITFVDSDDWIHPQMYEFMMEGLYNSHADIAQCGVCDALEENNQIILKHRKTKTINNQYQTYDKIRGVIEILDDTKWQSYFWNKIYKKKLFSNIQFPIGRGLDEDTSVMYHLFHRANSSIYFESEFYFYLKRIDSICNTTDENKKAKNIIDRNTARWEKLQFTLQHPKYHEILNKVNNVYISFSLQHLRWIANHKDLFPKHIKQQIISQMNQVPLAQKDLMPQFFSKMKKIEYFLFKHLPTVYHMIIK